MTLGKTSLKRHFALLALSGILCGATALRWANIGAESLWVDEIYSYRQAIKSVEDIILNAPTDVHPPTYYLLLHWWTLAFGTSEAGLRSLSAALGVAGVACLYGLGASLGGRRVGLYAALFLALSHFHVHYSQEARSYSFVALVSILGAWAFVALARGAWGEGLFGKGDTKSGENSRANNVSGASSALYAYAALYLAANTALLYSHFFAVFAVMAQNLFVASRLRVLWRSGKRRESELLARSWIAIQSVLVLIFTPWIFVLVRQARQVKTGFWIARPDAFALAETLVEYAGSLSAAAILLPLALLAFVVPRLARARDEEQRERWTLELRASRERRVQFLLWWFALPIILPFALSLVDTPIYYVKYTMPAFPAFLLLAALGARALERSSPPRAQWLVYGLCVALVIVALKDARNDWAVSTKEPWREAAAFLDARAQTGDATLVHEWYCAYNLRYYSRRADIAFQPLPPERWAIKPSTIERFFAPATLGKDRLWLTLSHKNRKFAPLILERIERDFELAFDTTFASRYRKYMVSNDFPLQTRGVFLMKTYWSNDIRVLLFRRKKTS